MSLIPPSFSSRPPSFILLQLARVGRMQSQIQTMTILNPIGSRADGARPARDKVISIT